MPRNALKRRGHIALEDGADGGEGQKVRKTVGPCSCCGARPSSTPWAQVEKKRSGQEAAVGDRCLSCQSVYSKGFAYMEWPGFVKLMMTEEPGSERIGVDMGTNPLLSCGMSQLKQSSGDLSVSLALGVAWEHSERELWKDVAVLFIRLLHN